MYNYLLFDWDGCIANTLPVWLNGYKIAFDHFGLHPSVEDISTKAFGDWHAPAKFGITDEKTFLDLLTIYVYDHFIDAPLNAGASLTLFELKKLNKIGLVTSSERDIILAALNRHHLQDIFDCLITKETVSHHKPDPEPINRAIQLLQGDKTKTLMIGDSSSDIIAAYRANIDSCLYKPSAYDQLYTYNFITEYPPTHTISCFEQLVSLVVKH